MTKYIVNGGKPLFGEVEISGLVLAVVMSESLDGCAVGNIPVSDIGIICDFGIGFFVNSGAVLIDHFDACGCGGECYGYGTVAVDLDFAALGSHFAIGIGKKACCAIFFSRSENCKAGCAEKAAEKKCNDFFHNFFLS